jgi:hypothetical protein
MAGMAASALLARVMAAIMKITWRSEIMTLAAYQWRNVGGNAHRSYSNKWRKAKANSGENIEKRNGESISKIMKESMAYEKRLNAKMAKS